MPQVHRAEAFLPRSASEKHLVAVHRQRLPGARVKGEGGLLGDEARVVQPEEQVIKRAGGIGTDGPDRVRKIHKLAAAAEELDRLCSSYGSFALVLVSKHLITRHNGQQGHQFVGLIGSE